MTALVSECLDAGRRVEHVPVVNDLALEFTDLRSDHVAGVDPGFESGYHAVFCLETLPMCLDLVLDQEEHFQKS